MASEDILVNVDSDNLIGPGFPIAVVDAFKSGLTVVQFKSSDSTCGRVACLKEEFDRIHGYDEHRGPCGYQDFDLCDRLKLLENARFQKIDDARFTQAIDNDPDGDNMKARNDSKLILVDPLLVPSSNTKKASFFKMDVENRDLCKRRTHEGQIERNLGVSIGFEAYACV